MNRIRTAAVTAASAVAVLATALPAHAWDFTERSPLPPDLAIPEPVTTCGNGQTVTLAFTGMRNVHRNFDEAGEPVYEMRQIRYTGTFAVAGTSMTHTFPGTRIITIDIANNLFTSVGNYRTVPIPGSGLALHETGRYVQDWDGEERYFSAGPKFSEYSPGGAAATCGIFGLPAPDEG